MGFGFDQLQVEVGEEGDGGCVAKRGKDGRRASAVLDVSEDGGGGGVGELAIPGMIGIEGDFE